MINNNIFFLTLACLFFLSCTETKTDKDASKTINKSSQTEAVQIKKNIQPAINLLLN